MTGKLSPFDIAKNINAHGPRLDAVEVGYDAFMMNRIYSNTRDTILIANELNIRQGIPAQSHYDIYRFGLDKNKTRFGKWNKPEKDSEADLNTIMEVYKVSRAKALDMLPILIDEMDTLRKSISRGGEM